MGGKVLATLFAVDRLGGFCVNYDSGAWSIDLV